MSDKIIVSLIGATLTPVIGLLLWHIKNKASKNTDITQQLVEKTISTYDEITNANKVLLETNAKLLETNSKLTRIIEVEIKELKATVIKKINQRR